MPYQHDVDACFADRIGEHGLVRASVAPLLAASADGLAWLRDVHGDGSVPMLRLPERTDDLAALEAIAARFRNDFDDVVVLGTGGSSLGAQALCALAGRGFGPDSATPRLHFIDTIDPHTIDAALDRLVLARTGLVVVSKSGSTAETITQFLLFDAALSEAVGKDRGHHAVAITEPGPRPLRALADARGMAVLNHDPVIGGRFSVLSLVGILPAMIAGLDIAAFRAGAAMVLQPVLGGAAPESVAPAVGAAINVALARDRNIAMSVLMPYSDRLDRFSLWFRQLWAESLGKRGHGTTPVRAAGTVDQHSQLQLYLDGPRDKLFTLVLFERAGQGKRIDATAAAGALDYLGGRTVGDLMDAEQRATVETLARNGCPIRLFRLSQLNERSLGALMMHFMLETVLAARLLNIDPFDQPAVEQGKLLTREYLSEMGGGS